MVRHSLLRHLALIFLCQILFKVTAIMRLNSPKFCKDIQPILLQYLRDSIERFFCNCDRQEKAAKRKMDAKNYS